VAVQARLRGLSVQTLQEFLFKRDPQDCGSAPQTYGAHGGAQLRDVVCRNYSADLSLAVEIEDESKIGFWTALIVATAAKSGAVRILSDDLNARQRIAGVRIENPFRK